MSSVKYYIRVEKHSLFNSSTSSKLNSTRLDSTRGLDSTRLDSTLDASNYSAL